MSSSLSAGKITIAVAANVSYAIEELKAAFMKANPQISVAVILGSSGKLTAQIKNGAPYGLFMSANMKYPQALYHDKIAVSKPVVYAQGALAYLSVQERNFSKGISLLEDEKITRIAIANPKTAPYGKAAVEAMKNAGVYERIKVKLVYAESISQTVSYTVTAAQIGLIAKSSLYSPQMADYKEGVNWMSVDSSLYTPIKQGVVLLRHGRDSTEYKAFYDFILSDQAKKILKRYGYIVL
jgi:molybdate transport system substrate-binding protein